MNAKSTRTRFSPFLALILLGTSSLANAALEPWADEKLPVTDGLELWLDASRQNTGTTGFRPVPQGGPVDIWRDASGKKRHVRQELPEFRPRFFGALSWASVRFDGTNDFLSASGLASEFENVTVFIRAAPRTNSGDFRGILSFSATSANDYSTGLNIDLSPKASKRFVSINVEGRGFVGVKNLLNTAVPFGAPHVVTLIAQPGENGVQLWFDGVQQGSRAREKKGSLSFDEVTIGSRFFSNTQEPAHVQKFFEGDIFDVLIYSRVLEDDERSDVEKYLAAKNLVQNLDGRKIVPLETVKNPPPVQMFLPGFVSRELPVKLNNINCVKYREDGKLVALGYDGKIGLLSDSDGDGLEDNVIEFWNTNSLRSPIGMDLTPPNYSRGQGVFVASKGKLSLIVDTNRDDVADEEIVVATGWPGSFHQVDTLGVAVDKDGSIFFGIGTVNFADGYVVSKETGKSTYNLKDERGTILKVSPDFSKREIVCTGIRFPVALAFNSNGDLFCTDQEGATWLPNGNPFDELLHIEPNRHYGFPPRHPKHLPGVIDEPSVFDYGPQHQSTCGLNFNEPVNGGKIFGPSWWRGDAFVAGYSRGKLWRTKLAKTASGYVAQNHLIACLNMMPSDACISPDGDLIVAVHSGQPDWGSGPTGEGKIYKISLSDKQPQPVLIWAASPTETCIEFDRPLSAEQAKDFSKQIKIVQSRYAGAGDQFETLRPGYQVVMNQLGELRYELEILSIALENGGRTVVVRSVPRKLAVNYAVTIPRENFNASDKQLPVTDLAHDLSGVEATWNDPAKAKSWTGWLPHLDLSVAREFTRGSKQHDELWKSLARDGELKLRTQFDLWQMLRAATQPGSKLDYEYPPETVTLVFKANAPLEVSSASGAVQRVGEMEARFTISPKENVWPAIDVLLQTKNGVEPALEFSWFTEEDSRPRAMPLRRIFLPWALPEEKISPEPEQRTIPEIAGGDWLRGRKLFFGPQLACATCHATGGEGGRLGPDLSNLLHRDYASVMKDIAQPNAAINPDHVAYNVELKNEGSLTGVAIGGGENEVHLADASGKITKIAKDKIVSMKPSAISLMPEGLLTGLSEAEIKDLFTFLLMPAPLKPAPLEIKGEPPPRKRLEIEALSTRSSRGGSDLIKKPTMKIVLAAGPKDHGPGEHDYPLWQKRWSKLFGLADGLTVETSPGWPTAAQFSSADVIVFYSNNPGWSAERASDLDTFLNRGGGLVYIHFAVDGHKHCDELAERIGLAWRGGASKFRHGPLDLKFQPHEITKGFDQVQFVDESYWQLIGSETNIQLLASGIEEGKPRPLIWVREQGKGRVFVSIPGHFTWTFDDPLFRALIFRGIAWTAREPLDRFDELWTIGARISD